MQNIARKKILAADLIMNHMSSADVYRIMAEFSPFSRKEVYILTLTSPSGNFFGENRHRQISFSAKMKVTCCIYRIDEEVQTEEKREK